MCVYFGMLCRSTNANRFLLLVVIFLDKADAICFIILDACGVADAYYTTAMASSDRILSKSTRAAAQLVSRCIPRRSTANVHLAEGLASAAYAASCGDACDEDDIATFRAAFLDTLAVRVEQRVGVVSCRVCPPQGGGSRLFVASEYNRSGNSYRCPTCNAWQRDAEDDDGSNSTTKTRGPVVLRWLEYYSNALFQEYAHVYYANRNVIDDTVVASSYAWLLDDVAEDDAAVPARIGIAVYIVHTHKGDAATSASDSASFPNEWSSSHVGQIHVVASGVSYSMQSTILLDVVAPTVVTRERVHGFVSTETSTFTGRPLPSTTAAKAASHIVCEIGDYVQRLENQLRESIEAIYFGKVGSMMSQNLRTAGASVADDAAVSNVTQGATEAPHDDAHKTIKKKKKKAVATEWECCYDDEGNAYYYHAETGETSWEPPPSDAVEPPLDREPPQAQSEETAAEPAPISEVVDVLDVLCSLGLTGNAADYHKSLRRYLRQFYGLKLTMETFLQVDDPAYTLGEGEDGSEGEQRQVLDVLVPVFGDRRKIARWIAKARESRE